LRTAEYFLARRLFQSRAGGALCSRGKNRDNTKNGKLALANGMLRVYSHAKYPCYLFQLTHCVGVAIVCQLSEELTNLGLVPQIRLLLIDATMTWLG
jgi:hypothetical protein